MEITIKKEDFTEKLAVATIIRVQNVILDRKNSAAAVQAYGVLMANIFVMKQNDYENIKHVCDVAIAEISENDKLKKFISFVIAIIALLAEDFIDITISVGLDGDVDIQQR